MMWTTIEALAIAAVMSGFSYWFGVKHGFKYGFREGANKMLESARNFATCVREGTEVCKCETCTAIRKAILG